MFLCTVLYIIVCSFSFGAIVLSVLFRFTASNWPFSICKRFYLTTMRSIHSPNLKHHQQKSQQHNPVKILITVLGSNKKGWFKSANGIPSFFGYICIKSVHSRYTHVYGNCICVQLISTYCYIVICLLHVFDLRKNNHALLHAEIS